MSLDFRIGLESFLSPPGSCEGSSVLWGLASAGRGHRPPGKSIRGSSRKSQAGASHFHFCCCLSPLFFPFFPWQPIQTPELVELGAIPEAQPPLSSLCSPLPAASTSAVASPAHSLSDSMCVLSCLNQHLFPAPLLPWPSLPGPGHGSRSSCPAAHLSVAFPVPSLLLCQSRHSLCLPSTTFRLKTFYWPFSSPSRTCHPLSRFGEKSNMSTQ